MFGQLVAALFAGDSVKFLNLLVVDFLINFLTVDIVGVALPGNNIRADDFLVVAVSYGMVVLFLVNDGLRSIIIDPVIPGVGLNLSAIRLDFVILVLADGLLVPFVINEVIISAGNRTAGIVFRFRYFVLVSILVQIVIGLVGRDLPLGIRLADESVILFLRDLFRSTVVVILGIGCSFRGITLCVLAVLYLFICRCSISLLSVFALGISFSFRPSSCLRSSRRLSHPSAGHGCRCSIVLCLN